MTELEVSNQAQISELGCMRAQPKRTDWADTYNGTTTISVGTLEVQVSIASSSDIANDAWLDKK